MSFSAYADVIQTQKKLSHKINKNPHNKVSRPRSKIVANSGIA